VVKGATERIHFIFDVTFNGTLARQSDRAKFVRDEKRENLVGKIESGKKIRNSYPGDPFVGNVMRELRSQGFNYVQIADASNAKKIPTKRYFFKDRLRHLKKWNASMIGDIFFEQPAYCMSKVFWVGFASMLAG
jgi:hypothetical protein